MCIFLIVVGLA